MRGVAITVIHTLAWIAAGSGAAVAAAPAADPSAAAAAAGPGVGPQEVMAALSASLFAALDKDSAAVRHNADKVLPLIDRLLSPHFDMEYSGRLVLGLHWRSATAEQRRHLAIALYQ